MAGEKRDVREYILPDGRTVHVTKDPLQVEPLRRHLSRENTEQYDVYVRNSPEHLEVLRSIQSHRRQKHEEIRKQHSHVFDELDPVAAELDALAAELSQITHRHVALDANFDRFGYAAHIRIREADGDGEAGAPSDALSQEVSPSSISQSQSSKSIKFWKRPSIRQYFYRGLIWRSPQSEEVAPFELFIDLLYVGIVAITGDAAAEGADGESLLQFVVTFYLAWKIWTELVLVVQWFETDDIVQRLYVLLTAILLLGLSTNIADAFRSTYVPLMSFYIAGRVLQVLWLFFIAFLNPMFKVSLLCLNVGIIMPVALWIASIHVEYPNRLALIFVAIFLEMFDKSSQVFVTKSIGHFGRDGHKKNSFMAPAINIEHRTERQNAFVILIFGYMAVNLLFQHSGESSGMNGFFAKAAMGLIIAFSFNLMYFEIDSRDIAVHAIRRDRFAYLSWQSLHLLFVMAFTLASGTLARLVLAHDSPNTHSEQLMERYAVESEGELKEAHRWFFSAGLGIALICMSAIAMTHSHKDSQDQRVPRMYRYALRLAVSVVMICLPLAGERLNSTDMIGINTALVVLVLATEYWGSTSQGEPFWYDGAFCSYAADCKLKKGDMENLGRGGGVDITHVAEKNIKQQEGAHEAL